MEAHPSPAPEPDHDWASLYPHVLRVASGIVGQTDAEDVAHDAFLRLLVSARPRSTTAWLATVTRNLSIDEVRRRTRAVPVESVPDEGTGTDAAEVIAVRDALNRLSERYRKVLWLKHAEGRTAKEIAQLLDTTQASVELSLFRARRALREELEPEGRTGFPVVLPLLGWCRRTLSRLASAAKPTAVAAASAATAVAVSVAPSPASGPDHAAAGSAPDVALVTPAPTPPPLVGSKGDSSTPTPKPTPDPEIPTPGALSPLLDELDRILEVAEIAVVGTLRDRVWLNARKDDWYVDVNETLLGQRVDRLYLDLGPEDAARAKHGTKVVAFVHGPSPHQPVLILHHQRDGRLFKLDGADSGLLLDAVRERSRLLRRPEATATPSPTPTADDGSRRRSR